MARNKAAPVAKPVVEDEDRLDAREELVVKALECALNALPKDLSKLNRDAIKALMTKTVGTGKDALTEEVRAHGTPRFERLLSLGGAVASFR